MFQHFAEIKFHGPESAAKSSFNLVSYWYPTAELQPPAQPQAMPAQQNHLAACAVLGVSAELFTAKSDFVRSFGATAPQLRRVLLLRFTKVPEVISASDSRLLFGVFLCVWRCPQEILEWQHRHAWASIKNENDWKIMSDVQKLFKTAWGVRLRVRRYCTAT